MTNHHEIFVSARELQADIRHSRLKLAAIPRLARPVVRKVLLTLEGVAAWVERQAKAGRG
jgi:hypothetical protein